MRKLKSDVEAIQFFAKAVQKLTSEIYLNISKNQAIHDQNLVRSVFCLSPPFNARDRSQSSAPDDSPNISHFRPCDSHQPRQLQLSSSSNLTTPYYHQNERCKPPSLPLTFNKLTCYSSHPSTHVPCYKTCTATLPPTTSTRIPNRF
jgi:hypothetical protein